MTDTATDERERLIKAAMRFVEMENTGLSDADNEYIANSYVSFHLSESASQSREIAELKRQVEVAKDALRQLDRGEFESLLSASKIGREALKQMEAK